MKRKIVTLISIGVVGALAIYAIFRPSPVIYKIYYSKGQCTAIQSWLLKKKNIQPIDYKYIRTIPIARDQIKAVIKEASAWPCLPYGHWFRIGFDPYHSDIILSDEILEPHKKDNETVWIYIQHRYRDLEAWHSGIQVTVYFNHRPQRIFIPYEAITWFDDPEHDFLIKPWADKRE